MPGNPLPKIEINASRWPYDENGPVNGKFGQVAVTPAPKAILDAENIAVAVANYAGVKKKNSSILDMYRVIIDGKQTGAYAVTDNVVNAFRKAVESGSKTITAERV